MSAGLPLFRPKSLRKEIGEKHPMTKLPKQIAGLTVLCLMSLILMSMAALPSAAQDLPGRHPGYLHALTDLRTARWLLSHQPGDPRVYADEDVAIQ